MGMFLSITTRRGPRAPGLGVTHSTKCPVAMGVGQSQRGVPPATLVLFDGEPQPIHQPHSPWPGTQFAHRLLFLLLLIRHFLSQRGSRATTARCSLGSRLSRRSKCS